MQLNLDSARVNQEIEDQLVKGFERIDEDVRKNALERVAVRVLAGLVTNANGTSSNQPPVAPREPPKKPPSPSDADGDEKSSKHWQRVLEFCRAHPTQDGIFYNAKVAEALFPDRFKTRRNVVISTVYTATRRRSKEVVSGADIHFVILGRGRFRIATADDRAKTKGV